MIISRTLILNEQMCVRFIFSEIFFFIWIYFPFLAHTKSGLCFGFFLSRKIKSKNCGQKKTKKIQIFLCNKNRKKIYKKIQKKIQTKNRIFLEMWKKIWKNFSPLKLEFGGEKNQIKLSIYYYLLKKPEK